MFAAKFNNFPFNVSKIPTGMPASFWYFWGILGQFQIPLPVLGVFHSSCCIDSDATRWHLSHLVATVLAHCGNVPWLLALRVALTWSAFTEDTVEAIASVADASQYRRLGCHWPEGSAAPLSILGVLVSRPQGSQPQCGLFQRLQLRVFSPQAPFLSKPSWSTKWVKREKKSKSLET